MGGGKEPWFSDDEGPSGGTDGPVDDQPHGAFKTGIMIYDFAGK